MKAKYMIYALVGIVTASLLAGCEVESDGKGGFRFAAPPPPKPSVPVELTTRESVWGYGKVAQFHNQTNHQLTVTVLAENFEVHQRMEFVINLPPNGTVELGWDDGWKFEPKERVTVSHSDYSSKSWTIR